MDGPSVRTERCGQPPGRPHRWMATGRREATTESRLQADSPSPRRSEDRNWAQSYPDSGRDSAQFGFWEGSRPDVRARRGQTAGMDLRGWITGEHAAVAARFGQSVVATVPLERWGETGGAGGSSIAFLTFHVAYHEDVAVNAVLRGGPPVLDTWRDELGIADLDGHIGLAEAEPAELTATLDMDRLLHYVAAVHDATASWLAAVDLARLDDHPGRRRRPRRGGRRRDRRAVAVLDVGRQAGVVVRPVGGHRSPCQPSRRDGLRAQPNGAVAVLSDERHAGVLSPGAR